MILHIGERRLELSLKGKSPGKVADDYADAEEVLVIPQHSDDALEVYRFCCALKAYGIRTILGRYVLSE